MNCQELTDSITNIKLQMSEFDHFVDGRNPKEAIRIMNEIRGLFIVELFDFIDTSYDFPNKNNFNSLITRLLAKQSAKRSFTKKELNFIYGINYPFVNGFRVQGRFVDFYKVIIKNIRNKLNHKESAPIVLNCKPEEIVWNETGEAVDIPSNTRAYIGPLFPNIFKTLNNVEYIYTDFPELRIRRGEFTTSGKIGPELLVELKAKGIKSNEVMLQSSEFIVHKPKETISTIRLKVSDLFSDGQKHDYPEIKARAQELGLATEDNESLPHETAANLLLNESTQPNLNEEYSIDSKTIESLRNGPAIFSVAHDNDGLSLGGYLTGPRWWWSADQEVVFRLHNVIKGT